MPFLRVPLSIALVLFVPGYCLTAAVFPRRADLTRVQRIGLSIALSIASMALLILLLDALPWRLQPWALILGGYALIGGLGNARPASPVGSASSMSPTGSISGPRGIEARPAREPRSPGLLGHGDTPFVVLVGGWHGRHAAAARPLHDRVLGDRPRRAHRRICIPSGNRWCRRSDARRRQPGVFYDPLPSGGLGSRE